MPHRFDSGSAPDPNAEKNASVDVIFFREAKLEENDRQDIRAHLVEMMSDPNRYIDRGGVATVHRLANRVCAKVLEPRETSPHAHLMKLGNSVSEETRLLNALGDLEVDGVRVPLCYGYWRRGPKGLEEGILMEELDAENVQRVLNGDRPMPATFNFDKFADALDAFISEMHEHGIGHDDLEPRNVMVDRKSGLPRVIDFGRSKEFNRLSEEARIALSRKDDAGLNQIIEKLEALTNS